MNELRRRGCEEETRGWSPASDPRKELRARIKIPCARSHRGGCGHRVCLRDPHTGRDGRHDGPRPELAGLKQRLGHRPGGGLSQAGFDTAAWLKVKTNDANAVGSEVAAEMQNVPADAQCGDNNIFFGENITACQGAQPGAHDAPLAASRYAVPWWFRTEFTPEPEARPERRAADPRDHGQGRPVGQRHAGLHAGRAPGLRARVRLRHHEPDQAGRQRDRAQALREQPGRDAQPGLQRLDAGRARPEHGPQVPGPPARLQHARALRRPRQPGQRRRSLQHSI